MKRRDLKETAREPIAFACSGCGWRGRSVPDDFEYHRDQYWHPWRYSLACPDCGGACEQAAWQVSLWKALHHGMSDEGKKKVGQNLKSPNNDMYHLNALQHGLAAKTAMHFPARPGRYAACEGCRHLLKDEPERSECVEHRVCLRRSELILKHLKAFQDKNPAALMELFATQQGAISGLVSDMILAISQRGVEIETPRVWVDPKTGEVVPVTMPDPFTGEPRQVMEVSANPLLSKLIEVMAKNGMTLPDMGMTPRTQEDQALLKGHLEAKAQDDDEDKAYRARQTAALENLSELIERGRKAAEADPVLVEYSQANDED